MIDENFDALSELLGCYLHQDWSQEFENDTAALQAILDFESKSQLERAASEIDFLLNSNLSEEELRAALINPIGCYFEPNSQSITYRQWLSAVRAKFIHALI